MYKTIDFIEKLKIRKIIEVFIIYLKIKFFIVNYLD